MTAPRVRVTLVWFLSIIPLFAPPASAVAQETNCSPTTLAKLQQARDELDFVRTAIAGDPSLGETSPAFITISVALAQLQIPIDIIAAKDPCQLSADEVEDFFDRQELTVENAMDLKSEGFLGGPLVNNAENAVLTILGADEDLLIALKAQLPATLPPDHSSSNVGFNADAMLLEAQALQAACELPEENVACSPDDLACDRDGSTCDNTIGKYSDLYGGIIEIIH